MAPGRRAYTAGQGTPWLLTKWGQGTWCPYRGQADIICIQEVGDHYVGNQAIQQTITDAVKTTYGCYFNKGYATLVIKGEWKVKTDACHLFPDDDLGREAWRRVPNGSLRQTKVQQHQVMACPHPWPHTSCTRTTCTLSAAR
jgi:hypothetical protein